MLGAPPAGISSFAYLNSGVLGLLLEPGRLCITWLNRSLQFIAALLDFCGSRSAAMVLAAAFVSCAIVGSIIPQELPLSTYRGAFPSWYRILLLLGINDIFHSPLFFGILLSIILNLLISNIKRLFYLIHQPPALEPQTFLTQKPFIKAIIFDSSSAMNRETAIASALTKTCRALHALHYKTQQYSSAASSGIVFSWLITAQKGRFSAFGSFFSHSGIALVAIGLLLSQHPALSFSHYIVLEPEVPQRLELPTGFPPLDIKLQQFEFQTEEPRPSNTHSPGITKNYRSHFSLQTPNHAPLCGSAAINEPFSGLGITFYQTSYSLQGFRLRLKPPTAPEATSALPYELTIPTSEKGQLEDNLPLILVPQTQMAFLVHSFYPNAQIIASSQESEERLQPLPGPPQHPMALVMFCDNANAPTPNLKKLGWLSSEHPLLTESGYKLELIGNVIASGLTYKKDAGYPWVLAGFAAIIFGLYLSFYWPQQTCCFALIEEDEQQLAWSVWTHPTMSPPSAATRQAWRELAQSLRQQQKN